MRYNNNNVVNNVIISSQSKHDMPPPSAFVSHNKLVDIKWGQQASKFRADKNHSTN